MAVKKTCYFCWLFHRPWKWKESTIGYIKMWANYPNTIDEPICWKCAVIWQQDYKEQMGYDAYIIYNNDNKYKKQEI